MQKILGGLLALAMISFASAAPQTPAAARKHSSKKPNSQHQSHSGKQNKKNTNSRTSPNGQSTTPIKAN